MRIFIADAFTNDIFMGNQAGIVIFEENEVFPSDNYMQKFCTIVWN